jgi:hypothetical protein
MRKPQRYRSHNLFTRGGDQAANCGDEQGAYSGCDSKSHPEWSRRNLILQVIGRMSKYPGTLFRGR